MQMVGHEAVLKNLYFGMMRRDSTVTIQKSLPKGGALNKSLFRIPIGDDQFAQQGLTAGDGKGDVIDADALPGCLRRLPMPLMLIFHRY